MKLESAATTMAVSLGYNAVSRIHFGQPADVWVTGWITRQSKDCAPLSRIRGVKRNPVGSVGLRVVSVRNYPSYATTLKGTNIDAILLSRAKLKSTKHLPKRI